MNEIPRTSRFSRLRVVPAREQDVSTIADLLRRAVPDCIAMPEREIREHLDEFMVLRHAEHGVIGSVAVRQIDGLRCELRGLVVSDHHRGCHGGSHLVRGAIRRAIGQQRQLVCVTMSPEFFVRHGFYPIPLQWVPEKPQRAGHAGARERVAMAWFAAPPLTESNVKEVCDAPNHA